jgi:hypothetical protein
MNYKVPIGKEAAELPFWHFPEFSAINHDTCQSGGSVLGLKFEPLAVRRSVLQKRNLNVIEVLHLSCCSSSRLRLRVAFPEGKVAGK